MTILPPTAQQFLATTAWQDSQVTPIEGGASTRLLYRLINTDGKTAILMDKGAALPPHNSPYEQTIMPTLKPFAQVAKILHSLGMSAPQIFADDTAGDFLLVEDFGERELLRLLKKPETDPRTLVFLTMDCLAELQKRFTAQAPDMTGLRHYTPDFFLSHLAVILDVYLPLICKKIPSATSRDRFNSLWRSALIKACNTPQTLMLRDFKPANTFYLEDRTGINALGLIDFETAGRGPMLYDVASTLRDTSARLSSADSEAAIAHLLSHFPSLDRAQFDSSFYTFATMRQVQWAGSCSLYTKQGRKGFLAKLDGIWTTIEGTLQHPSLADLKAWFDEEIPAPYRHHVPHEVTA